MLNEQGKLPENALVATWDVEGLFTNIPHKEGLDEVRQAIQHKNVNIEKTQEINIEYVVRILEVILENNIFEFDSDLYRQNVGAAMGCKPIPAYANIFMSKIDRKILEI